MVEYTDEEWDDIGSQWRKAAKMDEVPRLLADKFPTKEVG
jgi:hypothetical protein